VIGLKITWKKKETMKEPNEIDLLFQDGLNGLTFTPDPYVKENIDHAIASKKKRRRFLFILFPVLFGLTGFAAIGLLNQRGNEKRNASSANRPVAVIQEKDNPKQIFNRSRLNEEQYDDNTRNPSDQLAVNSSESQANSNRKTKITRNNVHTTGSTKAVKPGHRLKTKAVFIPGDRLVPSEKQLSTETGFEPNRQNVQADNTSEKPIGKIPAEQEVLAITENKPDSIVAPLPYSASIAVLKALKHIGSNEGTGKWSLSVLTYWEGEKRRKNDFSNVPFMGNQREIARVHASTFYAKAEIGYRFNFGLEILSGIGFRTSHVVQYGYLSTIIPPLEGTSSGVPQPINPPQPDTTHRSEKQSFRVNSIVLPIGFAYTFPITTKMGIRLSGGAEFAYGQITSRFVHPDLSAPKFNAFGCSVWLRPEFHYSFGRAQLFGFGTFNQSLSQQLKWNIDSRRNPAFGVGIGLRIQL
jgi:hypothetical protein